MKILKINIGLVGCGRWAQNTHVPYIMSSNAIGKKYLSGVITEEEGQGMADKLNFDHYIHDWKELARSEKISAAIISTPHQFHYEQIKTFLENGKHVHVDKPPTLLHSQFIELVELANHNDLIFSVHAQMKYMPGMSKVRNILASNFSSIYQVSGYFWQKLFDDFKGSWRADKHLSGGGIMVDSGYHTIDTVHYLLNMYNPTNLTFLSHVGPRNSSDTVGLLTYKQKDTIISVSAIRGAPKMTQQQRIEIFGDAGYIEFKLVKGQEKDRSIVAFQKINGEFETYNYEIDNAHDSDPLEMFIEVLLSKNRHMLNEINYNVKISGSVVKVLDSAYNKPI